MGELKAALRRGGRRMNMGIKIELIETVKSFLYGSGSQPFWCRDPLMTFAKLR